jgi:polyhydroxyalkanoate synthesis regulator phasin|tara:strand:+ start:2021 stop:2293 length:273 start_codon:yes stop_codon:yes gene_type:complete
MFLAKRGVYMSEITFDELKNNIDDWVKEMSSKVSGLTEVPETVIENTGNIQHNYEVVSELREEIDELKQEIKLLKLMHLSTLKQQNELKH